jgi:hypothetical protein
MRSFRRKLELIVLATGTVAIPLVSRATTATWQAGVTPTNWDAAGAWNPSTPNAVGDEAVFNTSGATANLDIGVTLGELNLNANTTIDGADTLTMESADGTNPGILPAIDLTGSGTTATISAPISYLYNSSVFTPRFLFNGVAGVSGTTLNINGGLTANGGAISFESGNYTQGSGSVFSTSNTAGINVGNDGGTVVLNVNANISNNGVLVVGNEQTAGSSVPGTGTVNQASGTVNSAGTVRIGNGFDSGSYSTYTPGVSASQGTYNMTGGSLVGAGAIVVGSDNGTGTLDISGASTTVTSAGELELEPYAGISPGLGGSGSLTLTDGTVTDNSAGTGTALVIGHVNPTAPSTMLIDGSTSTSGGRLVVATGALSIANQTIGSASTSGFGAAGAVGVLTIENGGTASIGGGMTVGGSIPSAGFISPNSATVSISGTTPASYSSKFSVGSTFTIGGSGSTGTFTADESDTTPILVGTGTNVAVINVGTGGFYTNEAGSTYNGGNGSMVLSGQTVMNVNSDTVSGSATIMNVGSSTANTVSLGTNVGSTGSITLSNSAVLNVDPNDNLLTGNVVIGSGAANSEGDAGSGTISLQNNSQMNMTFGNLALGNNECNGSLNVANSAEVTVSSGTIGLNTTAGLAPNVGGIGAVTVTDGTITDNIAGTGTAVTVGGAANTSGTSSFTINGSTSTSGGRLVVTNGSLIVGTGSVGSSTVALEYTNASGASGAFSIQNGGTMLVGAALTVGSGLPSPSYASVNTGSFAVSGTTPGAYTSKLSIGTGLSIGISGGMGTFTANESDTTPITVGSATTAGALTIGTSGTVTDSVAMGLSSNTAIGGGNGSLTLSGQTVFILNSNATAGASVMNVGASAANTVTPGTNVGSTGSVTLQNSAVLDVNTTSPNALNITIGNGVANDQGDAGSGSLTLNGSSQLNLDSGNLNVGVNETPGSLSVNGSAQVTLSGATASLVVGSHANSTVGSPDFSTVSFSSLLLAGTTSLVSVPSVIIGLGVDGSAAVSGGTLDATAGGIAIGNSTGAGGTGGTIGNGSLTVTGGTVETGAGGNLLLCAATTALASETGVLNLQGGLVQVSGTLMSNGTPANSLVNFTGGELQAGTINPVNFSSTVSQSALPVALQQTSNALVQTNTSGASLLHAATQNLAISGGYVLLGGAAQADSGQTISVTGLTSVNTGVIQGNGTFATSATSGFGINSTLTVSGPGIVNLNGPSFNQAGASLIVNGGTVNVSSASSTPSIATIGSNGIVNLNGFIPANANVTVNGQLNFATNLDANVGVLTLGSLNIGATGRLDITNNKLLISYSSPATDPIASIEQWIKNGFYDLSGPQIISSSIASDDAASGLLYGIGYADGADGVVAGLPSDEIEIMFTLLGDANLDGTVNGDDFSQFSHNLGQSGMSWDDGDFNYDGTVNSEDFASFSHNLGQTDSLASPTAGVLEAANGISLANVPEPASIGLLALGVVGVLAQRRRYKRTAG